MGTNIMYVKDSGIWKVVGWPIKVYSNSQWNTLKRRAIYKDGWKELVPTNAIILYESVPNHVSICNGTSGTPNLIEKYIRCDTNESAFTLLGGTLHGGDEHGAGTSVTSRYYMTNANTAIGFTDGASGNQESHTHTIPSHSHPADGENPNIPHVDLIPTMGGDKIYPNAIIPTISNVSITWMESLISQVEYLNSYIRFNTMFGYNLSLYQHTHSQVTGYTNTIGSTTEQLQPNQGGWGINHRHNYDHIMPATTTTGPISIALYPNKVIQEVYWNELPTGSLCIFTTSDMPNGWSEITEQAMLRFKGSNVFEESDTHTHSGTKTTSAFTNMYNKMGTTGSKSGEFIYPSHSHTYTDEHLTPVSTIPESIILRIGVKQ